MVLAEDGLFPRMFQRTHRFWHPDSVIDADRDDIDRLCALNFAELVSIYALVQSLAYMLIYAALIRLRAGRCSLNLPRVSVFRWNHWAVGDGASSVFIAARVIQRELFHNGSFASARS